MSFSDQLNPAQLEAVETTEGPLLILAGAGSGKTRVLTFRMAWLLQNNLARPWEILAVTFTNKAAGEMKERIEKLLDSSQAREIWVSTFHSMCLRILRRYADRLGYLPTFTIYDDKEQQTLIGECLEELKINPKMFPPRQMAWHINEAKNQAVTPEEFDVENSDFLKERVAKIYVRYQELLKKNQAMDFGDLIFNTLLLLRNNPDVAEKYQRQFKYIHVDEYQDTNKCQYLLIKVLAEGYRNLCVVGDDDQSIYKFRGADIRNILDFKKDFHDAHVVKLEQNYRSTQTIIKASAAVIQRNEGRMDKTLWTDNAEGDKITVYKAQSEKDESMFVARNILALQDEYAHHEVAIFYRTNAQSRALEDELRRQRIPYQIIGGMKFYDRAEIKDMLSYLKLLVNPSDAIALRRVINVPTRGIGKTTVEKIENYATTHNLPLWEALVGAVNRHDPELDLNAGTINKLTHFVMMIRGLMEASSAMPLTDFMTQLYNDTGYWKMLEEEKTQEAQSRQENLEELVTVVGDYVRQAEDAPTLGGFLDQAALVSGVDEADAGQSVKMMTFHMAKGLEFPLVFITGMEEGLFPHSRSLMDNAELEEERRLCYVGITRAMKKLYMTLADSRNIFGQTQVNLPSRFVDEMPHELVEVRMSRPVATGMSSSGFSSNKKPPTWSDSDFDQRPVAETYSDVEPVIQRGTRVKHPVFGVGTIRGLEGQNENQKLTIAFANGQIKKVLTKYANLEIV